MDCLAVREAPVVVEGADGGEEMLTDCVAVRERASDELAVCAAEPPVDSAALQEVLVGGLAVEFAELAIDCFAVREALEDRDSVCEVLVDEGEGSRVTVTTDVPGVTVESEMRRPALKEELGAEAVLALLVCCCDDPLFVDGDAPRAAEEVFDVLCRVVWPWDVVDWAGGGVGAMDALPPVTVAAMDENVDLFEVAEVRAPVLHGIVWLTENGCCDEDVVD